METKKFKTPDLSCATYLRLRGLAFTLDKSDPNRVIFIFEDGKEAETLAGQWYLERQLMLEGVKRANTDFSY